MDRIIKTSEKLRELHAEHDAKLEKIKSAALYLSMFPNSLEKQKEVLNAIIEAEKTMRRIEKGMAFLDELSKSRRKKK